MNTPLAKSADVAPPARDCRVLVVEDSDNSAQVIVELLEAAGHEVQAARNGMEALVVADRFRPQVVLIDIGLPGVDGLHVARQLRNMQSGALLVATTGRSGPDAERLSKEAGFDYHRVEPLDLGSC